MITMYKIYYHKPRPHMIVQEMHANGCSTEYGDPSGHALSSISTLLVIVFDLFDKYQGKISRGWKALIVGVNLFIIWIVGYSRLFNGSHSIDQILHGWLLGIWLTLMFHFILRDRIFKHIDFLCD